LEVNYQLNETDYHTQLMYVVSKSEAFAQTIKKVRRLLTIALILFAIIAFNSGSIGQTFYFIALGILSFIFAPKFTKWSYKKNLLKQVQKYYSERLSMPTKVILTENSFEISDNNGEATIQATEIEKIIEIENYIYIRLKEGTSIIIPKKQIDAIEDLIFNLRKLAIDNEIEWEEELNWKWI
jgi:hypothetical protein